MPGAVLQWVSLFGSLLIAAKLYRTSLHRRYPVFFAYFIFRFISAIWAICFDVRSNTYFFFYIFSQPVNWIFYVWVVLEMCAQVLKRHRGIYTLGKWAMSAGMTASVTISLLSMFAKFQAAPPQKSVSLNTSIINYTYAADRGVTLCMAIFLILMLLLLTRYPVPLSRNVVLNAATYTLFFISNTLNVILATVLGKGRFSELDTYLGGVSALCMTVWLLFLTPKGEEVQINVPHMAPESERRLLIQLDALNNSLLKAGRIEIVSK